MSGHFTSAKILVDLSEQIWETDLCNKLDFYILLLN